MRGRGVSIIFLTVKRVAMVFVSGPCVFGNRIRKVVSGKCPLSSCCVLSSFLSFVRGIVSEW